MFYAGIGSRKTPHDILYKMEFFGAMLKNKGYVLHSGGASGADAAFSIAVPNNLKIIFRPEHATPEAIHKASQYHPAWARCNDYVKKLHGRNAQIILGKNLDSPVEFVICWTPSGKLVGGTSIGIRIAQDYNIPVYNLAFTDNIEKVDCICRS